MHYRVELICHHPPHQCRCRHNVATEVDQPDLTANLIKHNPALLKYLGRPTRIVEIADNNQTAQRQREENQKRRVLTEQNQPYRSIVEEKGLRFIIDDQYAGNNSNLPNREKSKETPKVKSPRNVVFEQPAPTIPPPDNAPTSPRQKPKPMTSQQKDTKKYHKDLVNQSRYLSDTAFRKYFDRQCFQNYGRNNTSHKADGFVYGNYLKTFNINPHSGQNMPMNEETFYHALVSASPEKYALYTQEGKLTATLEKSLSPREKELNQSLEKDRLNVEKMLQDNMKHSKLEKKYDHLKLKTTNKQHSKPHTAKPKTAMQSRDTKAPSHLEINTKKNFKPTSPTHHDNPLSKTDANNPLRTSILNAKSQYIPQPHLHPHPAVTAKDALLTNPSPAQPAPPSMAASPTQLSCSHSDQQQSPSCACCLNQMKRMILQLAEQDADLADRIISSAQKTTLYKNYSLNNFQKAALNPKNYRPTDGRLNLYEP